MYMHVHVIARYVQCMTIQPVVCVYFTYGTYIQLLKLFTGLEQSLMVHILANRTLSSYMYIQYIQELKIRRCYCDFRTGKYKVNANGQWHTMCGDNRGLQLDLDPSCVLSVWRQVSQ